MERVVDVAGCYNSGASLITVIPASVRAIIKIRAGDRFQVSVDGDRLIYQLLQKPVGTGK